MIYALKQLLKEKPRRRDMNSMYIFYTNRVNQIIFLSVSIDGNDTKNLTASIKAYKEAVRKLKKIQHHLKNLPKGMYAEDVFYKTPQNKKKHGPLSDKITSNIIEPELGCDSMPEHINPYHYKSNPIETIVGMVNTYGWENTAIHCRITARKYDERLGKKDKIEQDVQKYAWYANMAAELYLAKDAWLLNKLIEIGEEAKRKLNK